MKNIKSLSILIQDKKGNTVFLIEKNIVEFTGNVKIANEEYYTIGSSLVINEENRVITNIQFVYRINSADFQIVITVK
jgi:uncharacterized Zn finger protein